MAEKLTPKSRLAAAAHKQTVDRPPCICPGGMMNMIYADIMDFAGCTWPDAHTDAQEMADLTYAQNRVGGFENYGVPFCMTVEAEAMGAAVDLGDRLCEPHVVQAFLTSAGQRGKLKKLDLKAGRVKIVLDAIAILKGKNTGVPVIGNITGPISVAGTLTDMSVLLREFRKSPEEARAYLDFISDNLIVFARAQIEAGADAICISEPSGTGEVLGPALFADFTITYLNKILDSLDAPTKIVHICGNLKSVYHLIPHIHCHAFSFDAVVPVNEIRKHLATQAAMGNISTFALGDGQGEHIGRLVANAVKKGVDIVAPSCGLATVTPLKNVRTMIAAVRHNDSEEASNP